jgi:hypothetical protein
MVPATPNSAYIDPFLRKQELHTVMVSGYVTERLSTSAPLSPSGLDLSVLGIFENTSTGNSAAAFTLQLKQAADISATGPRTNVGNAMTIVPGGRVTQNFTPTQGYLEMWCTSGGGNLRAQIASKLSWNVMGFSKLDPFYPQYLSNTSNGVSFAQLGTTGS